MSGTARSFGTNPLRIMAALALLVLATISPIAGSAAAQDADSLATRVQFVHGATDVGEVEVHINGQGELDEFGYGDVSDWIDIDPGSVRVTITADRAGFNYAIFDVVYPVPAGNDYYVVISDALILAGSFDTSPVADDSGRVQVTPASADTPAVNIVVSGTDISIPASYPKSSDSVELPAGSYDLDIQLAETGESLATVTGFTVTAGTSYQLVMVGDPTSDDKPIEIKVLETATSTGGVATPVASPVS
jgi:hypothetical protein